MRSLRALSLLFLFGAAASPLVVSTGFFWPFIEPKALWFRGMVGLSFALWIALCMGDRRYLPRPSLILALFGAVLALLLIANINALVPWLSFFGRTERMDGYFGFCYLGLFVLTATSLLDTDAWRRRFVAATLAVSVLVAGVGFWQVWAFSVRGRPELQVFSTLGNPTYLGQYAALMICLACWLSARARSFGRIGCALATILNLAILYLSQGRGAALALLAAGAVAVVSASDPAWRKGLLAGTIMAAAILVGMPLLHAYLPLLPRYRFFLDISLSDTRTQIWAMAWQAIERRPILGWGQEGMLVSGGWQFHVDRAHNLILDWLVQGGILGLALWLGLLAAVARRVWETQAGAERAALFALLVVYLVSDMVLFDTLTSYLVLGTVMALVGASPTRRDLVRYRQRRDERIALEGLKAW